MSVLRMLFAWLLLAALPLQGFAAATTLLCGPAHRGAAAVEQAGDHHHADGGSHARDHASAAAAHGATPAEGSAAAMDTGHSCNLCSAACHGVGLASQPTQVELASAPPVPLTEPFQRFDSRPAPVPDKPPRA